MHAHCAGDALAFCSNKYCPTRVGAADMGAGGGRGRDTCRTTQPRYLNVGGEKSNTDGMAEMEVGALSERALRCPGEHPSDEYECGEKLMSTRINAHHLT